MISRANVLLSLMHVYEHVHPSEPVDLPLLDEIADVVMGLVGTAIAQVDEEPEEDEDDVSF